MSAQDQSTCPFCHLEREPVAQNDLALAFPDGYPLTPGHTLVIPRRHVAGYFEMSAAEHAAIQQLLGRVREGLMDEDRRIIGFNIGVNVGRDAGQTIFHCHVHLIPRRRGDVEVPRGGIRRFWPGHQPYLDGEE